MDDTLKNIMDRLTAIDTTPHSINGRRPFGPGSYAQQLEMEAKEQQEKEPHKKSRDFEKARIERALANQGGIWGITREECEGGAPKNGSTT